MALVLERTPKGGRKAIKVVARIGKEVPLETGEEIGRRNKNVLG